MSAVRSRPAAPRPAPARALWRNAFEGALATLAAAVAMAAAVWAALALLGAGAVAPAARLVPAVVGMAFGGGITLTSAPSVGSGEDEGLGGMLGGLDLGLTGVVSVMPLTVTFLGTAVLALGFFRPLYRRPQPASELLWARFGGALAAAAVVFPLLAGTAHGTARLPEGVTERFGKGGGSEGLGGLGGGLTDSLSSVAFGTDVAVTVFFGLLWVCVVLGLDCLAARRTTLSRHLSLGQGRKSWHAVTSALSGITAVLCCSVLVLALLAGLASLAGREQAARAAGALLLLGPNLLAVLLTSGLGTPWGAGIQRVEAQGGGMLGGLGGAGGDGAPADRSVDLTGWTGAGVPLWLIGLLFALLLAVVAGYLTAARTPARTRKEEAQAVFGRNTEIAMRLGIAVGLPFLLLPPAARGSVGIGISAMGREMGGVTASLDGSPGLSALAAVVLAAVAGYGGIRLQQRRARRRDAAAAARSVEADEPRRGAPVPVLARTGSARGSSGPAS
ncbi:streptophobe family protein [Kitasatospora sp. NPDC008115]|uniref:streptophobe family protein n=1 Tax=Kitasatospora sp. NPDC008115 TaxID=3364022 RepID=UPI0036E06640